MTEKVLNKKDFRANEMCLCVRSFKKRISKALKTASFFSFFTLREEEGEKKHLLLHYETKCCTNPSERQKWQETRGNVWENSMGRRR